MIHVMGHDAKMIREVSRSCVHDLFVTSRRIIMCTWEIYHVQQRNTFLMDVIGKEMKETGSSWRYDIQDQEQWAQNVEGYM